MSGIVTFKPEVIRQSWVQRDLLFYIRSPIGTGPLASYKFLMQLEIDGLVIYEDPLDEPDANGRIMARDKLLDPHGGTLWVLGKFRGSQKDGTNPFINGYCHFGLKHKRQMHGGQLTFNVEPIVVRIGDTRALGTTGTVETDLGWGANSSVSVKAGFKPFGIGVDTTGTVGGSVTQAGDQHQRSMQTGEVRYVNSVQALDVKLIGAAN